MLLGLEDFFSLAKINALQFDEHLSLLVEFCKVVKGMDMLSRERTLQFIYFLSLLSRVNS